MATRPSKLRRDIRGFRKWKVFFAIPLILLGLVGLILPVIPGAIFLITGIILIIPSLENKIKL